MRGPRARPWLLAAVPLGFFGVFFAYPVGAIVSRGLVEHGPLDLGNLGSVVWFTVWQATVSTVVTVVAGLPAAYVLARFDFPGRRLLHAAVVTDHGYGARHDRQWRNKPSTSVSAIARVSLKVGKFTMRS